jgi:hypothetical protein
MRRFLLAGLAMLLVACGGDKATGPETLSGTYTLRTVDGKTVPAVVFEDSQERDEVLSGSITLSSDKSWSGIRAVRATDLTSSQVFPQTFPIGGTYAVSGGSITLTDTANQLLLSGSVGGGTLTIGIDLGLSTTTALVYRK